LAIQVSLLYPALVSLYSVFKDQSTHLRR